MLREGRLLSGLSAEGSLGMPLYKDFMLQSRAALSGRPEVFWLSPRHGGRWRRDERKEERKGDWCGMREEAVEV